MSDKSVISDESQSRDKLHDLQEKKYELRRAPPPPKFYAKSTVEIKSFSNSLSDTKNIRAHSEDFSATSHQCLISIINRLINKEQLYVLTLKSLMKELEIVSTDVCNKLPLLTDIINFHAKILIKNFLKSSSSIDIPHIFKQYEDQWNLHVTFANARKDFSYLVTDLCEAAVDLFKARLLEYNFTISQIKNICNKCVETQMICNEAEDIIKKIYQTINVAVRNTEEEDYRNSVKYKG